MEYRRRVIEDVLDDAFPDLAAVALEGAKGVGKTATASRRAATILSLSDPRSWASVAANFDLVAEVDPPVFIDEWQLKPQMWDRVRQAVDEQPDNGGRFLLAGSAGIAAGVRIHSGAGRIVNFTMRPMALSERGIQEPRVSLRAWLRAYAAATASTAGYTKILDAATAGEPDKPSRNTVDSYREHLLRLYILGPVEAWTPAFAPLKRLTYSPKHHLVGPALAARLIGVGAKGLLLGEGDVVSSSTGTWLGALLESLAVQSVRVYADAMRRA